LLAVEVAALKAVAVVLVDTLVAFLVSNREGLLRF
jgi:hypothetical protein